MIKNCSKDTLKFIRIFLENMDMIVSLDDFKQIDYKKRNELLSAVSNLNSKNTLLANKSVCTKICHFNFETLPYLYKDISFRLNSPRYKFDKVEKNIAKALIIIDDNTFLNFLKYTDISFDGIEGIINFMNIILNNEELDIDYLEENREILKLINYCLVKMNNFFTFANLEIFINRLTDAYIFNKEKLEKIGYKTKR